MRRIIAQIRKEFSEPMPTFSAVLLLIGGIFMGTVFTFGMHYWNAEVTRDGARAIEATFLSYKEVRSRYGLKEIIIRFEDYEQLDIDGSCLSNAVVNRVESIKPGTKLQLLVHPNSNTILEMVDNGEIILAFDDAMDKLSSEVTGFTILGVFMYFCAVNSAIKLIRKEVF